MPHRILEPKGSITEANEPWQFGSLTWTDLAATRCSTVEERLEPHLDICKGRGSARIKGRREQGDKTHHYP